MFQVRKGLVSLAFATALGLSSVGGAALAQEEDATPEPGAMMDDLPVAIHQGTCEEPTAEPAFEMENATQVGADEDDPEFIGPSTGEEILVTDETVEANLTDAAEEGHIVGVHASADEFGTLVACGEIGGVLQDGEIAVAIDEVDESGVTGIALLTEDESGFLGLGDDEINVSIYLNVAGAEEAVEEEATPEPEDEEDDEEDENDE